MNLALAALWLLLAVAPFWARPPPTFRWGQLTEYSAKDIAEGFGFDNSFLVYGAAERSSVTIRSGLTREQTC